MKPKKKFDTVLLEKMLRQGEMTIREIEAMMDIPRNKITKFRNALGIEKQTHIKCTVCESLKSVNCFRSDYPGICIICRRSLGIEINHCKGGRPALDTIRTKRTKCLKCSKPFLTRLGYNDQKINRICPRCSRTNLFLGEPETKLQVLCG